MNLFDPKNKIGVREILGLGFSCCPGYFVPLTVFSVLTGLFTPLVIKLQTYFIDFSTGHTGL
jgi:hypothetical protein